MKRTIGGRRGGIGLTVGVVAFLFQLFAWAWCPPVAVADTLTIPICTPVGMIYKTVSSDAGLQAAGLQTAVLPDAGGATDSGTDGGMDIKILDHGCPLCPLVAGLSVPPPDIDIALPGDLSRHGSIGLPGERIAAGWFLSTLQARAPPSAA